MPRLGLQQPSEMDVVAAVRDCRPDGSTAVSAVVYSDAYAALAAPVGVGANVLRLRCRSAAFTGLALTLLQPLVWHTSLTVPATVRSTLDDPPPEAPPSTYLCGAAHAGLRSPCACLSALRVMDDAVAGSAGLQLALARHGWVPSGPLVPVLCEPVPNIAACLQRAVAIRKPLTAVTRTLLDSAAADDGCTSGPLSRLQVRAPVRHVGERETRARIFRASLRVTVPLGLTSRVIGGVMYVCAGGS